MAISRLLPILLIAASACTAQPIVTGHKAASAPVLDARLDDAVWQHAERCSGFTMLGETQVRAEAKSQPMQLAIFFSIVRSNMSIT